MLLSSQSRSPGWDEAIEDFLFAVRSSSAAKTLTYNSTHVKQFSVWIHERENFVGGKPIKLSDLRSANVRKYLNWRRDQPGRKAATISERTLHHDALVIRKFLKFAKREGYIEGAWIDDIEIPRASQAHVPSPDADDLSKLLNAIDDRNSLSNPAMRQKMPRRDREAQKRFKGALQFHASITTAIVMLCAGCGCRIGEACSLTFDDYDRANRSVVFRVTKTRTPRTVPLEPEVATALDEWIAIRQKLPVKERFVFCTQLGVQMSPGTFYHKLMLYYDYAGIPRTPVHSLRRYNANEVGSVSIKAAQEFLGHQSVATTNTYFHGDMKRMRATQAEVRPVGQIMRNRRSKDRPKRII